MPGRTLDLSKEQLIALLTTKDQALVDSLYAFAEASTSAWLVRCSMELRMGSQPST